MDSKKNRYFKLLKQSLKGNTNPTMIKEIYDLKKDELEYLETDQMETLQDFKIA